MTTKPISKRSLSGALPLAGMAMATGGQALAQAQGQTPAHARAPGFAQASASSASKPRIVAFEEHFIFPEFIEYYADNKHNISPNLYSRSIPILSDFAEGRLEIVDENGIDFVVLSLASPGVQIEPDTGKATRLAKQCNDGLAKEVQKRPDR